MSSRPGGPATIRGRSPSRPRVPRKDLKRIMRPAGTRGNFRESEKLLKSRIMAKAVSYQEARLPRRKELVQILKIGIVVAFATADAADVAAEEMDETAGAKAAVNLAATRRSAVPRRALRVL